MMIEEYCSIAFISVSRCKRSLQHFVRYCTTSEMTTSEGQRDVDIIAVLGYSRNYKTMPGNWER